MHETNGSVMGMSSVLTLTVLRNGTPVTGADIILNGQARTTDAEGKASFDHPAMSLRSAIVVQDGKRYDAEVTVNGSEGVATVVGTGMPMTTELSQSSRPLLDRIQPKTAYGAVSLIVIAAVVAAYLAYRRDPGTFRRANLRKAVAVFSFAVLAVFGAGVMYLSQLSSNRNLTYTVQNTRAAENASLPPPKNVKVYADDKVATVSWDAPDNASGSKIVGYYVRWGKKSLGVLTDARQTIHTMTQIQPLENGVEYTVQVQSVQGTYTKKPTTSEQGGSDVYATANGELSRPVQTAVTASDARVVAMRQRLNGFFDDFNLPAGAFDEKKWNHATTACVEHGEDGQFINSQFHAHNQTQSTCDRDGNVSRPRAVFDITGRTEQDPGQIEFDMDGISQPRDVWYIDLIPTDARKNGMPVDVTSHNDLFDSDHEDPGRMIRIAQYADKIAFHYYDASNNPHTIPVTFAGSVCQNWFGTDSVTLDSCDNTGKQIFGFSPLPEPVTHNFRSIPNVRRHWVVQVSHDKLKLFIDSSLIATANTPALFSSINTFTVHSTIFSYNTGKQFDTVGPTTAMLHWDNFGFNAPTGYTPATVTHNYIDGGADGTIPMISTGTKSHPVPSGNRTTKIPIPDPIGSPVGKARLMFTMQPFGYSTYSWNSNQYVSVNGKRYSLPDPKSNIQSTNISDIAATYIAHSTGLYVDPADLKQGMNDVSFNVGTEILNVHIELDYARDAEPQYTQPKDVFSTISYKDYIIPVMRSNDSYWFIEQTMGLTPDLVTPMPTSVTLPTNAPTVTNTPTPQISNMPSFVTNTPTPMPFRPAATATPTRMPTATAMPTQTPVPTITPARSSIITIFAAGTKGGGIYPTMKLLINGPNGAAVKTWTNIQGDPMHRVFNTYTYESPSKILPDQVQIRFTNDFYGGSSNDRNLRVDKIAIDGIVYQTEAPEVRSTGSWDQSTGCRAGYKRSEWLQCAGAFHYR